MDWKDTVMTEEQLTIYWRNPSECNDVGIAEAQAKISFAVGFAAGQEEESTQAYSAGKHDGILRERERIIKGLKSILKEAPDLRSLERDITTFVSEEV